MWGTRRTQVLTICCGLSGAAGLIHELIWTRRLELLVGGSLQTAGAVLAVTMGGMALGAHLAGRREDRLQEGARAYGRYELLLAAYCLLLPLLQDLLEPLFRLVHLHGGNQAALLRGVLAMLLPLPGAVLLGASFPPVVADLARSPEGTPGDALARLYAGNTLGAFLGVLAGGLLLRPVLGTRGTLWVACGLSALAGALALSLSPSPKSAPSSSDPGDRAPVGRLDRWVVLGVYGVSGFTAMAYEVLLHRLASLWIGGSTYAFSMVLAIFLLGMALGSARFSPEDRSRGGAFRRLTLLQAGVTVWVLGLASVAGHLPLLLIRARLDTLDFGWMLLIQFLALLALLLPGSACLGATLPTAAACLGISSRGSASLVGRLYAVNAVGCVLGSLLAAHLLLPALGLRGALLLVAGGNWLTALAANARSQAPSPRWVPLALLAGAPLLVPTWDPMVLVSGPYLHAATFREAETSGTSLEETLASPGKVLFQRDGACATVTVRESRQGGLSLQVNGKTDASDGEDLFTQRMLAHLPLLLHPAPEDVLVIGLGSGVTAGEALRHPIRNLDVVEIAPEVVEGSRYFDALSGAPLDDPRTHLRLEDGRAWVRWTDRRYDVLSSEPSNPWLAGIANLFTREFFQLCRERLRPGGVMIQWLQAYSTSPEDFRSIVATFASAFPQCSLWRSTNETDFFLVGTTGDRPDGEAAVDRILADTPLGEHLRSIGLDERRLALSFVTDARGLASLGEGRPLVTDDDPFLEFTAPRNLYRDLTQDVLRTALSASHPAALEGALRQAHRLATRSRKALEARSYRDRALDLITAGRAEEGLPLLEASFQEVPEDPLTRKTLALIYQEASRKLRDQDNHLAAVLLLGSLLERLPEEAEARHLRALSRAKLAERALREGAGERSQELLEGARDDLREVLRQVPGDHLANQNLSKVLYRLGDLQGALEAFLRGIQGVQPTSRDYRSLGALYKKLGRLPRAALCWRRSLDLDPDQPDMRETLDLYVEVMGEGAVARSFEGAE